MTSQSQFGESSAKNQKSEETGSTINGAQSKDIVLVYHT